MFQHPEREVGRERAEDVQCGAGVFLEEEDLEADVAGEAGWRGREGLVSEGIVSEYNTRGGGVSEGRKKAWGGRGSEGLTV